MSIKRSSRHRAVNPTPYYELNPLRLQNIEDIESRHEIDDASLEVNLDKLSQEQRKNNIR